MSIESAKEFLERMKTDGNFAESVAKCSDGKARMAFVKNAGFDFTAEEINQVSSSLSDSELDQVAGGFLEPPGQCFLCFDLPGDWDELAG